MNIRPPSSEGPSGPRSARAAAPKPAGPNAAHTPTRAHGVGRHDRLELSPEALALGDVVPASHNRPPEQAMAPERLAAILEKIEHGGYDRWDVRREVIERVLAKLSGPAEADAPAPEPAPEPASELDVTGGDVDGVERA